MIVVTSGVRGLAEQYEISGLVRYGSFCFSEVCARRAGHVPLSTQRLSSGVTAVTKWRVNLENPKEKPIITRELESLVMDVHTQLQARTMRHRLCRQCKRRFLDLDVFGHFAQSLDADRRGLVGLVD